MKGKEEEISPLNHLQLKHQSSERYSYKVYSLFCHLFSIKMQDEREGEPDDKTIKIKEKEAKDLGERSDKKKILQSFFCKKTWKVISRLGRVVVLPLSNCPALRQAISALFLGKMFW